MKSAGLTYTRSVALIIISGILFFTGCSKSGSNPTPKNTGPSLAITSLSVNTGPYTTYVTINGSGFSETTADDQVFFNGVAATIYNASSTVIFTSVPLAAGTGNVTVTVNGKTATGPVFTYQPAEVVTLFAGDNNMGSANGLGAAARFSNPLGLTTDAAGNVYVADQENSLIRKITPAGLVSTFAGTGKSGSADGKGTAASFIYPSGLATDATGNIYVADKGNGLIRKITPDGTVTTLTVDATGNPVKYGTPYYVVVDGNGNVFFTDLAGSVIREISPQGITTTFYTVNGSNNGIYGLTIDKTGNLYAVIDGYVLKITPSATSTVFVSGFSGPWGITIDGGGNLYVVGFSDGVIRKVTPDGVVTIFGGLSPTNFSGPVMNVNLEGLDGITADASGNIYVSGQNLIRKISLQ